MQEPPWLIHARKYVGVAEIVGPKHNPTVVGWLKRHAKWINDDETAWCGAFVNSMLLDAGFPASEKPLGARSFENSERFYALKIPALGCIVTLHTGNPKKWQGHTGIYLGETNTRVRLLGGNQGNRVSESYFPKSRVTGYWWPNVSSAGNICVPHLGPVALKDDGSPVPTDR